MKKIVPLLFCVLILCSCSLDFDSADVSADIHAQYFSVELKNVDDHQYWLATIKPDLTDVPDELIAPEHINGHTVHGLANMAFGTYDIVSVYVPKSYVYLSNNLLFTSNVKKIIVPDHLKDEFSHQSVTVEVY